MKPKPKPKPKPEPLSLRRQLHDVRRAEQQTKVQEFLAMAPDEQVIRFFERLRTHSADDYATVVYET